MAEGQNVLPPKTTPTKPVDEAAINTKVAPHGICSSLSPMPDIIVTYDKLIRTLPQFKEASFVSNNFLLLRSEPALHNCGYPFDQQVGVHVGR